MTTASDQPTAAVATDEIGVVPLRVGRPLDRRQRARRRHLRRQRRSRSSRASRRSASAPACTSAPPASAACTTWSTRSSTTPSTRPWPGTATASTSRSWPTAASGSSTTAAASPSTIVASEGRPAVEVVLTVLHAGGKFGGGGYAVSGGLHGVGVSVVNALSRRLEVEVRRDGYVWTPVLRRGRARWRRSRRARPTDETGTTVTFWADAEIFETTDYDFETLSRALPGDGVPQQGPDHLADATSGPRRTLDGRGRRRRRRRRRRARSSYRYEGGLADFVKHLNATQGRRRTASIIAFEAEERASGGIAGLEVAHAVEHVATPSRSTPSPTPSTPTRAAPTRRASARRSPRWSTSSRATGASSRRRTPTSPATTSARA